MTLKQISHTESSWRIVVTWRYYAEDGFVYISQLYTIHLIVQPIPLSFICVGFFGNFCCFYVLDYDVTAVLASVTDTATYVNYVRSDLRRKHLVILHSIGMELRRGHPVVM